MITLFHVGPKGFNIGNLAIEVGMRRLLLQGFGQMPNVVSIPATSRFEAHRRAGLTAGVVHEINQYADGVIVGGGNLLENGQLEIDPTALQALEPPMMLFSVSWGRIYNRSLDMVSRTDTMPDPTIRSLCAASDVVLPRDSATSDHLERIDAGSYAVAGCPTLFLGDVTSRIPEVPEADKNCALVSIRNPSLMNIPLSHQARLRGELTEILELLADRYPRDRVRLLCHDHRDIPFAASFDGWQWMYPSDVYSYLGLLREAAVNISYRLHSALPCMEFETPFVKISYDERALSLMADLGLADWNIDMVKEDTVEEVLKRLDNMRELPDRLNVSQAQRDGLRERLSQSMTDFVQLVQTRARL